MKMELHNKIRAKYNAISACLNEKALRIWVASEAKDLGWGGVTAVACATGISRSTIHLGLKEIENKSPDNKIRRTGGGRKKLTESFPKLLNDLELLIDPVTRGDPESSLRWTCKSTRKLAEELEKKGYSITQRTICDMLVELGYSLQSNRKNKEGAQHPDRNKQFEYIYRKIKRFQKLNLPVISVDTKKKELIGAFKNQGKEYRPKGNPEEVNCHDFPSKEITKAAPYGVYDLTKNDGWVSVGISSDTSEFAVATIKKWWNKMGKKNYRKADKLLITADCGGSNGYRVRLWKLELQKLANQLGIEIHVCHFPPGTSKWNKIEHRLFSFITKNWRGRPLKNLATIVNLIGSTKTSAGLKVKSAVDKKTYRKGIKVSDKEFKKINITKNAFHGEWNYTIKSFT